MMHPCSLNEFAAGPRNLDLDLNAETRRARLQLAADYLRKWVVAPVVKLGNAPRNSGAAYRPGRHRSSNSGSSSPSAAACRVLPNIDNSYKLRMFCPGRRRNLTSS